CDTRAPGDATRMRSVLDTFFHSPVSRGVEKRRIQERISGSYLCIVHLPRPTQYLLTIQQTIENGSPIPLYLADVFQGRQRRPSCGRCRGSSHGLCD
ncbi:hypothetical protein EDB85DRAFT_1881695, partial [Lactarius pseudohatsudake]